MGKSGLRNKQNKTKHKHQKSKGKSHNWKQKNSISRLAFSMSLLLKPLKCQNSETDAHSQWNWCTLVLQILLTIVLHHTTRVSTDRSPAHPSQSRAIQTPGKPATSDSNEKVCNVIDYTQTYVVLHHIASKRYFVTLISSKSAFKNIWKCFKTITGKGWNQIGLYIAIMF